jgi:hypothetical protein
VIEMSGHCQGFSGLKIHVIFKHSGSRTGTPLSTCSAPNSVGSPMVRKLMYLGDHTRCCFRIEGIQSGPKNPFWTETPAASAGLVYVR